MKSLPASPHLDHLKKQARHLLRDAHAGDPEALRRFASELPAVRALGPGALANYQLHLHDAQSVLAREFGLHSWTELKRLIAWKRAARTAQRDLWLRWVYQGQARERRLALRMLREDPTLELDPWIACAVGNTVALEQTLTADSTWANRTRNPLGMPPLVAVTHSLLLLEPGFDSHLLAAARLLLAHGADPNGTFTDPNSPGTPLSALFGAAGRTHNAAMTQLLLEAGANPNDNESLYHSFETRDPACTRLLLRHGARIDGTNAIGRALDYGRLDDLRLLLDHGGNPNERPWLHHAILRGRSVDHLRLLLDAGADLHAHNADGLSLPDWAQRFGRDDVLDLLRRSGLPRPLPQSPTKQFVAACARADLPAARQLSLETPDLLTHLSELERQALPELAATGNLAAVRTMLALGWPIETQSAWNATALHLAVYRGDPAMTALLLDHGASWRAVNGFGGDVLGTLAHASQEAAEDPNAPADYVACARTLIARHVPIPDPDLHTFSSEITDYFDSLRLRKT